MRRPVSTTLWILFTLFVVYKTTMPFNFSREVGWAARKFARTPWSPLVSADTGRRVSISDVVQNVLLFVPFGVLGVLTLRGARSRGATLAIVVGLGAALSVMIETLQLWTIDRIAATSDVLSNLIGALAGAVGTVTAETTLNRLFRRLERTGILTLPSFYPAMVATMVIVIAAWEPFDATLDVGSFAAKARALMRDPWQAGPITDEGIAVVQYALSSWVLARLAAEWRAHRPVAVTAIVGLIAAFGLEACQVIIASRMPSLEDAVVRAGGVMIGLVLSRTTKVEAHPRTWFVLLVLTTAAAAAIWMFSPFLMAPAYHSFGWFPFFGYYKHTTFETVSHVIELLLIYFPIGFGAWLVARNPTIATFVAIAATLVVAVPIEYGQGWFVGRYPDLTDIAVSVVGAVFGVLTARAAPRSSPVA